MRKATILSLLLTIFALSVMADSKETVMVNGSVVNKFATKITFNGSNLTLTYADGTTQTAPLEQTSIAFDYVAMFSDATGFSNVETVRTFGERTMAVKVSRAMTAGQWSAICLPFDLSASEIASIFGTGTKVATPEQVTMGEAHFVSATSMIAGEPYLICPGHDLTTFTLDNAKLKNFGTGSTFSLPGFKFVGTIDAEHPSGDIYYLADGNKVSKLASGGVIKGLHAYLLSTSDNNVEVTTFSVDDEPIGEVSTALLCDVNGDGLVNMSDVTTLINYILNKPIDKFVFSAADTDKNTLINMGDVTNVINYILKGTRPSANGGGGNGGEGEGGDVASDATVWDFSTLSDADITRIQAELSGNTGNWYGPDGVGRYHFMKALDKAPLIANGEELDFTKGLLLTCNKSSKTDQGNIRVGNSLLYLGNSKPFVIPNLKKGQRVTITFKSANSTTARTIEPQNLSDVSGFVSTTDEQTGTGTVEEDGDVILTPTGGINVSKIEVSSASSAGVTLGEPADLYQDVTSSAVSRNTSTTQMLVELFDGSVKCYDASTLKSVDIVETASTLTVTLKAGTPDIYFGTVKSISFVLGSINGDEPTITNNGVEITEARGWLESAYVKWLPYEGAESYAVYVKGGQYASYTKIDQMLVRNYGTFGRADMVGLKVASDYAFKVVPIIGDAEVASKASTAEGIQVRAYSREGFAHKNLSGVGAYNDDGTLKSGARVFYVTKNTAKTITCDVKTSSSATTTCTGLQSIIDAYQKGYDTTPMAFRIIGLVEKDDLDAMSSSEMGLQVKGNKAYSELNITIEGIGEDATLRGFGFLVRNAKSVEFRNFAILRCMNDGISLDTDNSNIWIHHMDLFYGKEGSGDKDKGDGTIDLKDDSKYVTLSYCHYWDTGKSNMFGMKSESGPNYISYDHNWFDHSDSRHPRVRTMSVHVWNNFFDNVAKYGVGATTGASVFVENNYFLKTKKPILSSRQGTDGLGSGTFSGEDGGMIKAYGNSFDRTAKNFRYYTQDAPASTGYDAYETSTRDEQVPSTEVTVVGGTPYDNFDTNLSLMYEYTVSPAVDVPTIVKGWYGAGRMNHGDIAYTFTDNVGDDEQDSAIDRALSSLIDGYTSKLVGIFGGEDIGGGNPGGGGDEPGGGGDEPGGTTINASVECTFTGNKPSSDLFTVVGNYTTAYGSVVVNGVTLNTALKMESSTSVTFTTEKEMTLTLVFCSKVKGDYSIKVDGTKHVGTADTSGEEGQGILTLTLAAGEHILTKANSAYLFYIGLE